MLRTVILTIGALMMLGGLVIAITGAVWPALWLFTGGALVVIGTVFERFYKPLITAKPGPGWTDTGERFVDPETGKMIKVFYNTSTGERQYAALDNAAASDRPSG